MCMHVSVHVCTPKDNFPSLLRYSASLAWRWPVRPSFLVLAPLSCPCLLPPTLSLQHLPPHLSFFYTGSGHRIEVLTFVRHVHFWLSCPCSPFPAFPPKATRKEWGGLQLLWPRAVCPWPTLSPLSSPLFHGPSWMLFIPCNGQGVSHWVCVHMPVLLL